MTDISNILLYVTDPAASTRFYSDILGRAPSDTSPNFVMFTLDSGFGIGLWAGVVPAAEAGAGGSEIGIRVGAKDEVDARFAQWKARGVTIAMPPTDLPFGRSFLARDPDGHRLRVYALNAETAA